MTGMDFADKVISFTRENALLSQSSSVVVGVSGGADSMALLHVLCSGVFADLAVTAVHVHHGLRGDEADRDEQVVRDYCARLAVPLHVEHVDVRERASAWNCGLEEAGRRVRYAAFESIRCKIQADLIATAHNADDAAETMVMHILRGCGVSGLVGIPAKRGLVVRPLLACTRAEIEAYCAAEHIPYIVDSTNADTNFTRNRVRHELLPLMRQLNPAVNAALTRLGSAAAQDEAYFADLATCALQQARVRDGVYARDGFLKQSMPVRVRMCRALLAEFECFSFAESHIEALCAALEHNRGVVHLPNDSRITVSAGQVMRYITSPASSFCLSVDALPFSTCINGVSHRLEVLSREQYILFQNVHKKFFKSAVDYDRIQGDLIIRCRQEGDYIHPANRKVGKTLKKLLQECFIPAHERNTLPLLCDDNGVLAVWGVGCDSRACPDDSTKHFLVWSPDDEPSYDG